MWSPSKSAGVELASSESVPQVASSESDQVSSSSSSSMVYAAGSQAEPLSMVEPRLSE